jgi:hypothetical protein
VVTLPTAKTGYPAARLFDRSDGLAWRPSGLNATESLTVDLGAGVTVAPNYLGCAGSTAHRLAVGGLLEGSPDGVAWTSVLTFSWLGPCFAMSSEPLGTAVPRRWWRLSWTGIGSDALQVSEVYLGRRVHVEGPDLLTFDPQAENVDRDDSRTEAGHLERSRFLGAERMVRLSVPLAAHAWLRSTDPYEGFAAWFDNVARAGLPFLCAWGASIPGNYHRDTLHARLAPSGGLRRALATPSARGPRRLELTLVGPRPWGP